MRFLKVFGLIMLFFCSLMFFMQNNEVLTQKLLLQMDFFLQGLRFISVPLPVYFLILLSFLIGALFTLAFFLVEKIRLTKVLHEKNQKLASLEQEVISLRNLPLEDKGAAATQGATTDSYA